MKTVAVDFDGVIHAYSLGWHDGSIYDGPIEGAFESLRTLMQSYAVVIFTSRDTQQVADWLFENGDFNVDWEYPGDTSLKFWNNQERLYITNRKIPASVYIDDRGIRFENWERTLSEIASVV